MICGPSLYFQINFHIILILTETSGLSKVISRAIAAPCSLDTLPGQGQHLPVAPPSSDGAMPLVLRDASSHLLVAPPTSGGATLTFLGAVSSWLPNFGFSGAWLSETHVEHEAPLAADLPDPSFPSKALFGNDLDTEGKPQLRHEVEHASSNRFAISCDPLSDNSLGQRIPRGK